MAEHESHAPQEATAQVVAAGARHSSEYHSFERHGFEDSVEQRHRKILVFAHVGRKEARDAARQACTQLYEAGLAPVMTRSDLETLSENWDEPVPVQVVHESVALIDIELGVVLGGDGSILRAAEMVRRTSVPLIGVNLGHVGFLAESEESDLTETVRCIVNNEYTVEERMAIDVEVWNDGKRVHSDWALNEASVEKGNREKMIEVIIEVDCRPLSSFGCDGVVMGTPTGSSADLHLGGRNDARKRCLRRALVRWPSNRRAGPRLPY